MYRYNKSPKGGGTLMFPRDPLDSLTPSPTRVDGGKRVPSGHNAEGVSDPQGKGRLPAKQSSGFAFGEMARLES